MRIICYAIDPMPETPLELPETSELIAFVRTVDAGSLTHAARELGLPRPTLGRRLARLEERLGVRLLRRTTRTMALTDAGEAFYRHARAALDALRDARGAVARDDSAIRGVVRLTMPPLRSTTFGELLAAFSAEHPEVRLEVDSSAQHVDLATSTFDVALRASAHLPPGLVARTLLRGRLRAFAAPSYLDARGVPRRVTDLAQHACIVTFDQGTHAATHWPLVRGGTLRIEPMLASNDLELLRCFALAGRGIALLPEELVHEDVQAGRLIPVLPERLGGETRISVIVPDRELTSPAARALVETIVSWARGGMRAIAKSSLPRECPSRGTPPAKSPPRGRTRR